MRNRPFLRGLAIVVLLLALFPRSGNTGVNETERLRQVLKSNPGLVQALEEKNTEWNQKIETTLKPVTIMLIGLISVVGLTFSALLISQFVNKKKQ